MPLFLRHKTLLIHIPKCGGVTFGSRLEAAGDPPFLQVTDGSVLVNGHTPQHLTLRELRQMGWVTPPDFRVIALVRHPVDRVLSAYRYARAMRPDLGRYTRTPGAFLKHFFTTGRRAFAQFDQHNIGLVEFLIGDHGHIDPAIELWPLTRMDDLLATFGLGPVPPAERRNVTHGPTPFDATHIQQIRDHVRRDLIWFERRFPDVCETPLP